MKRKAEQAAEAGREASQDGAAISVASDDASEDAVIERAHHLIVPATDPTTVSQADAASQPKPPLEPSVIVVTYMKPEGRKNEKEFSVDHTVKDVLESFGFTSREHRFLQNHASTRLHTSDDRLSDFLDPGAKITLDHGGLPGGCPSSSTAPAVPAALAAMT